MLRVLWAAETLLVEKGEVRAAHGVSQLTGAAVGEKRETAVLRGSTGLLEMETDVVATGRFAPLTGGLVEAEALTGVPVLVNTSFNVKGEPIVETPRDAIVCFLTTGIDHLVLHDTLISKNALHRIVGPLVGVYTDVATMVMSSTRPA